MGKINKVGYELSDINLIQAPISDVEHRAECDPTIELCGRRVYPVIVAPMGAVTDENNYKVWLENGFICVVPRTVDLEKRLAISKETYVSVSLNEAEKLADLKENLFQIDLNPIGLILDDPSEMVYSPKINEMEKRYICIDVAHGTMSRLYKICDALKHVYGDKIEIMTGNVANPEAYPYYSNHSIDYMRMGIGTGSRCTTSCNVGQHYPTATLIDDTNTLREEWDKDHLNQTHTKLIMDGGIANFDDIQKSLVLGADFVMSGNIFARAEEACEDIIYLQPDNLNLADGIPAKEYFDKLEFLRTLGDDYSQLAFEKLSKRKPYRKYYGMSTKYAQKKTGGSGKTTSEGIIKPIPVEYPIAKWAENMRDYLKSSMSYSGARTLEEYKEYTDVIVNLSGDKAYRK